MLYPSFCPLFEIDELIDGYVVLVDSEPVSVLYLRLSGHGNNGKVYGAVLGFCPLFEIGEKILAKLKRSVSDVSVLYLRLKARGKTS